MKTTKYNDAFKEIDDLSKYNQNFCGKIMCRKRERVMNLKFVDFYFALF